nr:translation initiation factor IF-2-like [Gorilla gorilla gorilla]
MGETGCCGRRGWGGGVERGCRSRPVLTLSPGFKRLAGPRKWGAGFRASQTYPGSGRWGQRPRGERSGKASADPQLFPLDAPLQGGTGEEVTGPSGRPIPLGAHHRPPASAHLTGLNRLGPAAGPGPRPSVSSPGLGPAAALLPAPLPALAPSPTGLLKGAACRFASSDRKASPAPPRRRALSPSGRALFGGSGALIPQLLRALAHSVKPGGYS